MTQLYDAQTKPRHRDEERPNTNSHMTAKRQLK